jgi:transporter family protein
MSNNTLAVLIGGIVPAVCFGLSGASQKAAAKAGIGTGPFLVVVGLVVVAAGAAVTAAERDTTLTPAAGAYAAVFGVLWAVGVGAIAVALGRYGGQISQLAPIYNANTLVAVAVGLIALGESPTVLPARLLLASVLVIVGGALAATATK